MAKRVAVALLIGDLAIPSLASAGPIFAATVLTAGASGGAGSTDANLEDPWGLALSPTSPAWIADHGSNLLTTYDGFGVAQSLVVTVPASPTGMVYNPTADFGGALFLAATDDGKIEAWESATPGTAITRVLTIANYTGLAIGNNGSGNFLYAADFSDGSIDIYDASFAQVSLSGNFVDPVLPADYRAFNVQNIGGQLYVTFVQADASGNPVDAAGNGIIDVFDPNGNFVRRFSTGGALNSPWGLSLAPATFGTFGGALLVGNVGDGFINAFDLASGSFLGTLSDASAMPLAIDGLRGLAFGNGGTGFDPAALYFTAGGPAHGLFGRIDVVDGTSTGGSTVPEPGTLSLLALGGVAGLRRIRGR
jgi:uncharacterized protein (TIGR03118 family)